MCSLEKKDLKLDLPNVIVEEIFEYLDNSAEFYMLSHDPAHPICTDCRSVLENRAMICDTNMVSCPHTDCRRTLFVA
jgi:hypothetical protein